MPWFLLLLIAPLHAAPNGDIDWDAAGHETAELLAEYIKIDTINPPGNETAGAQFLADALAADGISAELVGADPDRQSLIARLPGSGLPGSGAAPLCLLSHIDVATAEPGRWPTGKGPLSGVIDETGRIWGRGALDMKGMGALQVMTLRLMARRGVVPDRDIVLLAVADEEVDNTGIREVIDDHWDRIGCSHVINEGGMGIRDMFFEGQHIMPISVGEKGYLWARLVASGPPGHGSTPRPGQAPETLHLAVAALRERSPKPEFHDSLLELMAAVGAHEGGLSGKILESPAMVRTLLKGKFMSNPLTAAAVTDTINVTGFSGALEPNVVPSEISAQLDCRLQPGTEPASMIAEIEEIIDDPRVRVEVISATPARVSPWQGDPIYDALVKHSAPGRGDVVAGPVISVGFTDSIHLRAIGVRAYGWVPFLVSSEEIATMHGDGESVTIDVVTDGLRAMVGAVEEITGAR